MVPGLVLTIKDGKPYSICLIGLVGMFSGAVLGTTLAVRTTRRLVR